MENTAKSQASIVEEQDYQCMICYEYCRVPVSCENCKKLCCQDHCAQFKATCPNCRIKPCSFIPQTHLVEVIKKLVIEERKSKKMQCQLQGCNKFEGNWEDLLQHALKEHPEDIISLIIGEQSEQELKLKQQTLTWQVKCETLAALMRRQANPPEGENRKDPNSEQRARMIQHTRICEHVGCKQVWSGRWGSFIGGEQGRNEFDLTDCVIGRQLNEEIGWNYQDPRH